MRYKDIPKMSKTTFLQHLEALQWPARWCGSKSLDLGRRAYLWQGVPPGCVWGQLALSGLFFKNEISEILGIKQTTVRGFWGPHPLPLPPSHCYKKLNIEWSKLRNIWQESLNGSLEKYMAAWRNTYMAALSIWETREIYGSQEKYVAAWRNRYCK